jgi:RHS repeat-associated protein
MVDSSNVIATYEYDAFGAIRAQTGSSDNPSLFTGEQRDAESGFTYLRARYYDSLMGRFLSRDSAGWSARVPEAANRYGYALNDPVNLTDPAGLCPICNAVHGTVDRISGLVLQTPGDAVNFVNDLVTAGEWTLVVVAQTAKAVTFGVYAASYALLTQWMIFHSLLRSSSHRLKSCSL